MISYKIELRLDRPIEMISNEFGHKEYETDRAGRISSGISSFNEKYHGRRCVFVVHDSRKSLDLAAVTKDGCSVNELMSELMRMGDIGGKYTFEEITFSALDRCTHRNHRNNFSFDTDLLDPFLVDEFTRCPTPEERLAKEYKQADIVKKAELGLFDAELLPELERIALPKAVEGAKGHPVHYIIRGSGALKTADMLISKLYENGRVQSRRYTIINDEIVRRANWLDVFFLTAGGGTVVIDLEKMTDNNSDRAVMNMLSDELIELVRDNCKDTLTVFTVPNELEKTVEAIKNALPEQSFVEINERLAMNSDAKKILRAYAREDKLRADKELLSVIAEDTAYRASELHKFYLNWYGNALKTKVYPQYSGFRKGLPEQVTLKQEGDASKKLAEMIGLDEVKRVIDQAVTYSKMQKLLSERGMPQAGRAMNMVFTGNPGTAKTTVARLFAQILKDNGVLSAGELIECGRSDLVGKYVGWTAVQVKNCFKRAKGSVLFIDEAYSLLDYNGGSYGDEAINTIVQEMENNREDTVVIFAGYPKEMNEFIERNPGLRSRISFHIDFPDYSAEELMQITKLIVKNNKYKLAADAPGVLMPLFERAAQSEDFGNGRFARNLVEQAQLAQAVRLSKCDLGRLSGDELLTLTGEDFAEVSANTIKENEPDRRRIGFSAG